MVMRPSQASAAWSASQASGVGDTSTMSDSSGNARFQPDGRVKRKGAKNRAPVRYSPSGPENSRIGISSHGSAPASTSIEVDVVDDGTGVLAGRVVVVAGKLAEASAESATVESSGRIASTATTPTNTKTGATSRYTPRRVTLAPSAADGPNNSYGRIPSRGR